jgi:hypothetical protein
MPTISQLASATAAADPDEIPVSQAGITRKLTRAQMLAGLQQRIVTQNGTLLGRASGEPGDPEAIKIGSNLILSGGTLSASVATAALGTLPRGIVPVGTDLVAVSQDGKNVAIEYQQLLSGLPGVTNVDVSNTVLTALGSTTATTLSEAVGTRLSLSGGTVTGVLSLLTDPTTARHAAPKAYVDTMVANRVARAGGTMTGVLTLSGAPTTSLHAATKGYVDSVVTAGTSVLGGSLTGVLTLAGDPVGALDAVPKKYADLRVERGGDTMTGMLTLADDPTLDGHAASKKYVDTATAARVASVGGSMTGPLLLNADPQAALQAATKQYVDARLARVGGTMTGALVLAADPILATQAATKAYVDSQTAGSVPRAGGTMTGALMLHADPVASGQASTKKYVDQALALAIPSAGGTVTGNLTLATAPTATAHAATKAYVDGAVADRLSLSGGGTVTGTLVLTQAPTTSLHAVNKQYVDANPGRDRIINVTLPPYGAKLDGVTDDTAAFKAAYQAAPEGSAIYVPSGVTVLQSPDTWGIPITKRVKWIVSGTVTSTGITLADCIPTGGGPGGISLPGVVDGNTINSTTVSRGRSLPGDMAAFHTSCLFTHDGGTATVLTNNRSDTIVYNSPANFIWGGLDRLVWAGKSTPDATAPAQHVARYLQTVRQTVYTDATGVSPPQPELWAACIEYRDVTGKASSVTGASLTVEMDWFGNGPDDAKTRQIQSLIVGQHDTSGAPVDVSSVIGVYLAGGSKGQAQKVFNVGIPFSGAVLDTTHSTQLPGASAIRLAAGHSIAFDAGGSNRLVFDSTTGTLRWHQGSLSYAIGRGISVGWQNVATANVTLGAYMTGNIVFLAGSGAYTVTLPPANTVAAGQGYTFSAVGTGTPTIAPSAGDALELGPMILRQHDRYHVISDGVSSWRELFRTNAVSPRFSAPPVLPSYTVANLPTAVQAGAKAFVSNGRKPTEATGAGTGVEVFFDGTRWISVCNGSQVAA